MSRVAPLVAALALAGCQQDAGPILRPLPNCAGFQAPCLEHYGDIADTRDTKRVVARTTGPYGHVLAMVVEIDGRLAGGEWRKHRLSLRLDTSPFRPHPGAAYAAAGPSALHTDRGILELRPTSLFMGRDDGLTLVHAETGAVARHWAPETLSRLGFMDLTDPVWMRDRTCFVLDSHGLFAARDWQLCHNATFIPLRDGDRDILRDALATAGLAGTGGGNRIAATPYIVPSGIDPLTIGGR